VLTEPPAAASTASQRWRDVSAALTAIYGSDYGIHSPTWISRFTDMTRAGGFLPRQSACCWPATPPMCIPPVGGQGLNTGVQDAVNLGWKLAQVVKQTVAGKAFWIATTPERFSRSCPRAAQHDGASRASPYG